MSNYIEYHDTIAFHPGYYIKEIVDESGLTQEDFAKRLDTTPKNLSLLVRGEQNLSIDIAMKLSRMIGTSVSYWLRLQNAYDALIAEFKSEQELELERDMAVSFRSSSTELSRTNIIKANTMVQIAINQALIIEAPRFNRTRFHNAVDYALTLTKNHVDFYPLLKKAFLDAGVIFVILPNLSGSKINGATKKLEKGVLLMVNDRRLNSDTFWFTLFHEIGHILNGDYDISFEKETREKEEIADRYAADTLIDPDQYKKFIQENPFNIATITRFADTINRDPGIVLGRLENDKLVAFNDPALQPLRHKYKVKTIF